MLAMDTACEELRKGETSTKDLGVKWDLWEHPPGWQEGVVVSAMKWGSPPQILTLMSRGCC